MCWEGIACLLDGCFSRGRAKVEGGGGGVGAGGIIFSSRGERMRGERFTYDIVLE